MEPLDRKLVAWLEKVRDELVAPTASDGEHPLEGCLLEGARIGKLLGVGSFAAVFVLTENVDGKPLAVKVLERKKGDDAEKDDELFRREVDIGMRLDHPTIARIHRFVELHHSRFVVLDQVQGQTWEAFLERAMPSSRYRELFAPFVEGLSYAHRMGVVHRDLKPENLMLANDGRVIILDFGMARLGTSEVSSTVTGQFKGTPMYCAPEQIIDSKRVTPACDQFSFGLLSFQLLTGQFPYPVVPKQPLQTLFARLQQPARRLSEAWPEAGEQADQVMARILAMKPEERYPTVEEAFIALSTALPG